MNRTAILTAALLALAPGEVGAETADDWTERDARWYAQSYWEDANILQRYTFAENAAEKVTGKSSVQVHLEVADNRPKNMVELRLELAELLDLSAVEAVEVSLKMLRGDGLRPTNVFFCSPGFQKLTVANWPDRLDLSPGGAWQRAAIDLTDARVLDKAKPGEDGEYDRRDVTTICLNFTLGEGPVDAVMLIDGMRATKMPPPPAVREDQADGSYVVTSARYRAVVGANGYLRSLKAGPTEFLKPLSIAGEETGSACFVDNDPAKGIVPLGSLAPRGRTGLKAEGEKLSVEYAFREDDFDIVVRQTFTTAGLLQFAVSPEVTAALDGRTDQALRAEGLESGPQIDSRLMTSTGGVLSCRQYVDGYSRMSMGKLQGDVWAFQFLAYGAGPNKLTLRPLGEPNACEAVGFRVECPDPDFLRPGGEPVRFDLTATSYAASPLKGQVTFQVCDYLTREPVGEKVTAFELGPSQTLPVPTAVPLTDPGPYRGKVIAGDGEGNQREIGWVFAYDFPNYRPASTRPADFHEFWQATLDKLAQVPMDAQLTPVPDENTDTAEVFKVSLATLGGRRVHCWYWKPKKPGRYPAHLELPSSGVYPRTAKQVPRGADRCGMWMAIHGLPVDVDTTGPRDDPAAWNYWTHGIESRETSMWRTIYASLVRGMDFLCSRDEVDPKRIMVAGGSQGGGLTMVLAGLDKRVAFAAPAHSGLCRLDWTVLHKPGFWPFGMDARPAGQTTEQFLNTLSYFDAANFTPDITCPVVAEVSLLDTVTASGNQLCALAHVRPGLLELICDPWRSHAASPEGQRRRGEAINRWFQGEAPVRSPAK